MSEQKREILRPLMNVPYAVALRFETPREIEGRYGPQMMFTVVHEGSEKLMFFDPTTAKRIQDLGLAVNEAFTIQKREQTKGRQKGIEWVIARPGPDQGAEVRQQEGSPATAQAAAPQPQGSPAGSRSNESQRSTRRGQVVPMPGPEAGATPETPSPVQMASRVMGACLIAAVDALLVAQGYALQQGLKLQWNEEDVRATGTSLFIQHHRDAGFRDAGFAARQQQTPAAAGGAR